MEDQTDFQLSVSENEDILEIAVTGKVTRDNVDQLNNEVIKLLKGKNVQALLVDVGAAQAYQETYSTAYFRVRSLPLEIIKLPTAVVDPKYNEAYTAFYETTATNVGQSAKWFTDIEAARTWLMSKIIKE